MDISIKSVLDSLSTAQRKQLMYAFENEFAQFIKLPEGKFIGVYVRPIKHLKVEASAGNWYYGTIMKGEK